MAEQSTAYKYEVGQLVRILKTLLAGHSGRIASRSISRYGRISYVIYGLEFGEEDITSCQN